MTVYPSSCPNTDTKYVWSSVPMSIMLRGPALYFETVLNGEDRITKIEKLKYYIFWECFFFSVVVFKYLFCQQMCHLGGVEDEFKKKYKK